MAGSHHFSFLRRAAHNTDEQAQNHGAFYGAMENNTALGHDATFMAEEDYVAPSQHIPPVLEEIEDLLDSTSEEDDVVSSKVAKEGIDETGGVKHNDVTLDYAPPQKGPLVYLPS